MAAIYVILSIITCFPLFPSLLFIRMCVPKLDLTDVSEKTEQAFGDGSIRIARPERALWERRPQRERVRLGRIDCSGNHPVGPHGQGTDLMEEETEVSEVAG